MELKFIASFIRFIQMLKLKIIANRLIFLVGMLEKQIADICVRLSFFSTRAGSIDSVLLLVFKSKSEPRPSLMLGMFSSRIDVLLSTRR